MTEGSRELPFAGFEQTTNVFVTGDELCTDFAVFGTYFESKASKNIFFELDMELGKPLGACSHKHPVHDFLENILWNLGLFTRVNFASLRIAQNGGYLSTLALTLSLAIALVLPGATSLASVTVSFAALAFALAIITVYCFHAVLLSVEPLGFLGVLVLGGFNPLLKHLTASVGAERFGVL